MKQLTLNNTFSDLFRYNFENAFNDSFFNPNYVYRNTPVNIYEDEKQVFLEMAIPGYKRTDLEISIEKDLLIVKGKKEKSSDIQDEKYVKKEFAAKEFTKSFRVDPTTDEKSIVSKLEDGILKIQIPKAKKVESKRLISIC